MRGRGRARTTPLLLHEEKRTTVSGAGDRFGGENANTETSEQKQTIQPCRIRLVLLWNRSYVCMWYANRRTREEPARAEQALRERFHIAPNGERKQGSKSCYRWNTMRQAAPLNVAQSAFGCLPHSVVSSFATSANGSKSVDTLESERSTRDFVYFAAPTCAPALPRTRSGNLTPLTFFVDAGF